MRLLILSKVFSLLVVLGLVGCASRADGGDVTHFANGRWFDGEAFVEQDVYVADGRYVERPRGPAAVTVDLAGGFVSPAFAEAHHHMALCNQERIARFLSRGIVYAGIMNARVSSRVCAAQMHRADGLEIVNALAGITAEGAHPSQIGLYFLDADAIDGEWVHFLNNAAELDAVWNRVTANPPDILKIFLSYSEDYGRMRDDPSIPSWYRGLDPALVAPLVDRAHAAGIRVAAHVMSAHDFDVAIAASVDIIAHMPGFAPGNAFTPDLEHLFFNELAKTPARYLLSETSAREAASRGVAVMTTVSGEDITPSDIIRANFATLQQAGVRLLIGSDRGEYDSVDEALYLVQYSLMAPRDVLRSIAIETPNALFPDRRIGESMLGREASFVVLGGDPFVDFAQIANARAVYKFGRRVAPQ